jgi:hypothetical protein
MSTRQQESGMKRENGPWLFILYQLLNKINIASEYLEQFRTKPPLCVRSCQTNTPLYADDRTKFPLIELKTKCQLAATIALELNFHKY